MTAWERLQECGPLRPLGSPCRICTVDPEQRHRLWDAITDRWHAGDTLADIAADYDTTPDDVAAVMVAQAEWLIGEARQEPELGAYRTGMRRAVAISFLGTIHADRVDLWISGLLADEQEETR